MRWILVKVQVPDDWDDEEDTWALQQRMQEYIEDARDDDPEDVEELDDIDAYDGGRA